MTVHPSTAFLCLGWLAALGLALLLARACRERDAWRALARHWQRKAMMVTSKGTTDAGPDFDAIVEALPLSRGAATFTVNLAERERTR